MTRSHHLVLLASLPLACTSPSSDEESTAADEIGTSETDSTDTETTTETSVDTETETGTTSTTGDGDGDDVPGGLGQRPAEPIVLVGGQVPGLTSTAPTDVVGFARHEGQWTQIPIQVDERVKIDFCTIYAKALLGDADAPCKTTQKIDALFYADPETYTGLDSDPTLDLDDEIAFMARDAGDRAAPGSEPAGVVAGTGIEVQLDDADETGWIYLFEREDAELSPDAGIDLIGYDLVFEGDIDYLTEYPFVGEGSCGGMVCDPPILEDSTITSPHYERHFSARWVTDSLRITTPGSTGNDILDIAQADSRPTSAAATC